MRKIIALLLLLISIFSFGCSEKKESLADKRYNIAKAELLTRLKDPDSYKVEYHKSAIADRLIKIKFRAKNSFGGYDINYAYAVFKEDGKLDDIFIKQYEDSKFEQLMK